MPHIRPFADDSVMLAHDNIYTMSDDVNILYPHGRGPAEWNNHFPGVKRRKAGKSIEDYLRECVMEAITHNRPGWLSRVETITIRTDYSERGTYSWVAWGKAN